MTATKREERIAELNELMQELEMAQRETLLRSSLTSMKRLALQKIHCPTN